MSSTEILPTPLLRELSPGTTFARRYQVIEDLGKGGMGRVYKVFDTEVREKLALKLLNPEIASDDATIERFRNELRLARGISHRNICRMHDLGREENTYYITMEYVSGEDLKSLIHRIGALPFAKAVSIARQVCDGLGEAHRVGVIHRDLKPQNIMIDRDGTARIMDFGIARSVKGKGITDAKAMIGTPEYMSPEQVEGKEADARSDIYALGAVLFEMLTGRLPFEGETPLTIAVKQKSEPAPDPRRINPQIPENLKSIVLKCLDKSRDKRYQTAGDLSADLARVEKALPATTAPLPLRKPSTSRQITVRLPSKRVWIPAIVALAAVIAFLVWQFVPGRAFSRRSIAVMGFKNQTGEGAYDYLQETIPNLLITSLEQSGHFRVTTWQQLKDFFRLAGRDESAVFDEEAGFEICRKEGIEALAVGFYTKAGDTFVTDVKVLDAPTRQPLKTAQSRGEGPGSILKTQIDEISRSISRGIGLAPLKIERSQPRIADLTTNSLEAYNYFLRGRDELERFFSADARRSLEKAVELDPKFAVAWLYLSNACNELADPKAGEEALKKAKQYSTKSTEKERLYIEANYAWTIEGNAEKRLGLLRELIEKYPSEKYARFELGLYYDNRSQFPEALTEYEKALALDPNFGYVINQIAYVHAKMGNATKAISYLERYASINPVDPNPKDSIAELYMRMGKLDESVAKYTEVVTVKPDFYLSWASLAYVYALQEKYDETDRCLDEFVTRAPSAAKTAATWLRAYFRYLSGRWDLALADYKTLRSQAETNGVEYFVMVTNWIMGYVYADRKEFDPARRAFDAFSALTPKYGASNPASAQAMQSLLRGWVDLKQGRAESARINLRAVGPLLVGFPSGTGESATFLFRLLTAEVALAQNSLDEAIAAAEKIVPQNIQGLRVANIATYNQPFLKDVLARAYWEKGDLEKAAAEYTRLMTIDPANQVRYLIHPLYHYRLGRVLEQKGEKIEAAAQYEKFLRCWKDADSSHPELADARRRFAALK